MQRKVDLEAIAHALAHFPAAARMGIETRLHDRYQRLH